MPRFAANLTLLYPEHAFPERFAAAARSGFGGVECLFPYAHAAELLRDLLQTHGLEQVLFNAPPGGTDLTSVNAAWEQGLRGTACLPGQEDAFQYGMALALRYAAVLGCPRIHVMAGIAPPDVAPQRLHATLVDNLRRACAWAQGAGVEVLIEPLNPRDVPGYFLTHQEQAHALVQEVGAANLKVQMDLYHCQIVEGDLAARLRRYVPTGRVGHIQIAGVPLRQEPDQGEVHYPYLLELLDTLGYNGWVGCEYRPRLGAQVGGTESGLQWLRERAKTPQAVA